MSFERKVSGRGRSLGKSQEKRKPRGREIWKGKVEKNPREELGNLGNKKPEGTEGFSSESKREKNRSRKECRPLHAA